MLVDNNKFKKKANTWFFEQCSPFKWWKNWFLQNIIWLDWILGTNFRFLSDKANFQSFYYNFERTGYALDKGYEFIFTRKFQSDPLVKRYRQMIGGRFLVSLREVWSTERILTSRSLLKQNINFREENLKPVQENDKILNILAQQESEINKLFLSPESKEVAYTISGYITNRLIKHFQCKMCSLIMVGNDSDKATDKEYFNLLSRRSLTIPSRQMAVCLCLFCYTWICRPIYSKKKIMNS